MDTRSGDLNTEMTDPEPVVVPVATLLSSDPEHSADRRWHVGTLTYTFGGLVVLFCWLLWGDFAWSIKQRAVAPVVQLLLKHFHSSDELAALLLGTIPPLLVIVISPIISYKSDRYRSRWGRRIPFLLIPTPIAALSMLGLALSPMIGRWYHSHGGSGFSANETILFFFGTFWVLFECATIIANSIFGAFVNDVVPQTLLGRFYGMFRAISLIAGMIFGWYLYGHAETYYLPIFIGIGLIYAFGFAAMCLKVKEGQYPPPPELDVPAGQVALSRLSAVAGYLRDCFGMPYYLWVFSAITVAGMAFLPINLFNIFYAKRVHMSNTTFGHLQAISYGISLLQAVPVGWLVDKFHPIRVGMVALVLHGAGALYGGLYGFNPHAFGIAFVLTTVFSGTYFTATAAYAQLLLPRSKFAQYASAMGIVGALGTMLMSTVSGLLLDWSHHQYRYTYTAGFVMDVLALLITIVLYQKFKALGGVKNYVAPE